MTDTNARLIELESRLAYQDDTIKQLNDALVSQGQDIAGLQKNLQLTQELIRSFNEQASDSGLDINTGPERPPHY